MPLWFGVKNLDNNGPHLENERKRPWLWHTGWSIIFNHHSTYHFILMILISEYFRWTCCEGNWRFIPWPLNDGRDAANLLGVLPSTTSKIQGKKTHVFPMCPRIPSFESAANNGSVVSCRNDSDGDDGVEFQLQPGNIDPMLAISAMVPAWSINWPTKLPNWPL